MTPSKQIIPGFKLPDSEMVTYAQNQPEYIPLPAWKQDGPEGLRVTRWKLSWKERFDILLTGSIWIRILTFNNPLQPILPESKCPIMGSAMLDEEV
jgi:hypothetical protein